MIMFRIAIDLISQHIADYLASPPPPVLRQPEPQESPAMVARSVSLMDNRKRCC